MAYLLGELLKWGKDVLKSAGLDDYYVSAELLLQSVLGLSRSDILLNPNLEINSKDYTKYKSMIEQRASRVPLQYLIGEVEFYNIRLQIDRRALIPRPETEILVETVIDKLRKVSSPAILDIGTGSGNIAIALAKNIAGSHVTGIDVSEDALELARANARLNSVENNTKWINGDIKSNLVWKSLGAFDCVVSNPPYVTFQERGELQPEVIEHEPEVALFSGDDPLTFFKVIIEYSLYILRHGGLLAFEVGMGQAENVCRLMNSEFIEIETSLDLGGIERVVTGFHAGPH